MFFFKYSYSWLKSKISVFGTTQPVHLRPYFGPSISCSVSRDAMKISQQACLHMLICAVLVRKCLIESFLDCSTGNPCADPESFLRGALSFDVFFLFLFFMRGGRIQIPL